MIDVIEARDRDDGTEDLFTHDLVTLPRAGDHGGLEEVAALQMLRPLAACQHARASLDGVCNVQGGAEGLAIRGQWTDGLLESSVVTELLRNLADLGFSIVATRGTKRHLDAHGIPCERVNKVLEGRPHIVDAITNGEIDIVFNTTEGAQAIRDSFDLRRTALLHKIPYYTTVAGALAATRGIAAVKSGDLDVRPLQSYFSENL